MINPSLLVVLIAVTINMMGVGLAWPILPKLAQELTGGTISQTAAIYGATAVVFSLVQFLAAPLMGALSDRFGRKPVLLVALTGLGFDNIALALAPSIGWMFVGRALGGALASTFSIANAYVADTMEEKDRARGFGLIGAAVGIGFIVGPMVGGVLGEIDLRLPFFFAAAVSLANVVFGVFFLRETLPKEKRRPKRLLDANPLAAISWIFSKPGLIVLALALVIATTMQRGLESVWVLYTQHRYGWSFAETGLSLTVVGIAFVFVQGYLVGKVVPWLGEMRTIVIGFALSAAMYFMLSVNSWGLLGFLGIIPHVIGWGCATPAIQSLISRQVGASEQGFLQGSLTGLLGLSAIVGPALSNYSFSFFTSKAAPVDFPGAYFVLAGLLMIVAAFIAMRAGRHPNQ